jgi:hypothetical protein
MVENLVPVEYEIVLEGYTVDGIKTSKVIQYTTDQGIEHVLAHLRFGHVPFRVTSVLVEEL